MATDDKDEGGSKSAGSSRAERLEAQLRANLKKRKERARARARTQSSVQPDNDNSKG